MKKNAKIVSLLIAALMLMPAAFSGPVCAEGEVHRYYVAQDADTRGTNDKLVVMACYPGKNTSGNSRFATGALMFPICRQSLQTVKR